MAGTEPKDYDPAPSRATDTQTTGARAHAYQHQCALCRLKHDELLDAAHIVPDAEPEGEPVVSNGLALWRLRHAIQGLQGQRIILPRRREHLPSVDLLAMRYDRFLEAATSP